MRSIASSRDEYLARPPAGERLLDDHARLVGRAFSGESPDVLFVISDGLNAHAVNEQLRVLLPPLRRRLLDRGTRLARHDVIVQNGRVRIGYEIGGLARSRARSSSDRRAAGHRSQYALRIPDVRPGRRRPPPLEVRSRPFADHRHLRHPSKRQAAAGGSGRDCENGRPHPGPAAIGRCAQGDAGSAGRCNRLTLILVYEEPRNLGTSIRRAQVTYFASGSGRTWKCAASGFEPLPPSISHGVRSPLAAQMPRPFQPVLGLSMRPSKPFE